MQQTFRFTIAMNRFTREVLYGNFNHLKGKVSSSMADRKINHDYVENYSEVFAETVVSKFFQQQESINGKEILSLTPSKQVNFLILKSLYTQWQAEMKKLESPYFDFHHEKVRGALMRYMNTVSQFISVGKEHLQPLLKDAVEDAIYLMFSPYDFFLADISVRNQAKLSVKNLKSTGKYIKINKDIFDVFISELEDKNEDKLSTDDVLETLSLVFENNETDGDYRSFISEISEVLHFNESEFFVEEEDSNQTPPDSQEEEIENLTEEESTDLSGAEDEEEVQFGEEDLPADDLEHIEDVEELGDIQAIAEEVKELREPPEEDDIENNLNSQYASGKTSLNEKLQSKEEVSIADHHTSKKVDSVLSSLSVNQRYMFINELFEGDNDEFLVAFEKIEDCKNFDDSVELLVHGYAKKYNWDMGSDIVKELLKTVFRKFR